MKKTNAVGIESDVHISKDGRLIIFRDASVDRTSNRTGLLYDKPLLDMDAYISRTNADSMHPRYMPLQYQPELTALHHDRGMAVNTWTVNDEENMRDMMARGVDCVISNYPDLLCQVVEEVFG